MVMWQPFSSLYVSMETPSTPSWKEDFQALREQEPPDCWDTEGPDGPISPQAVQKPWRGAAAFIPKVPTGNKKECDVRQVRVRQTGGVCHFNTCSSTMFSSEERQEVQSRVGE